MVLAQPHQTRRDSAGFTMVELLIVIVILGILATVTVFAVSGVTDTGQDNAEALELRSLRTANEAYWVEAGEYASEQDLVDNGYLTELSAVYDLTVDGAGVLTITHTSTGDVVHTSTPGSGGGGGGGGGAATFGSVTGVVTNATSDAPISGVDVCAQSTGVCDTTDGSGVYTIADVPTGDQTITFSRTGFTSFDEVATVAEGPATTQNTAMSPQLAAGEVRIVLTWGEDPGDLDSYLETPNSGTVSYSNRGSVAAEPFAELDVDDVDGFGPETITISTLDAGIYTFDVFAFGSFVPDETTVRVYDSSGLIREFSPPAGGDAWWNVFTLDGSTGSITSVNTITSSGVGS